MAGSDEDLLKAEKFFSDSVREEGRSPKEFTEACCVAARAARLRGDTAGFFKYAVKLLAGEGCSEICCEMGDFYANIQDFEEAAIWYYNAVYETEPSLSIKAGGERAFDGLIACYEAMGMPEQAELYREEARARVEPETGTGS